MDGMYGIIQRDGMPFDPAEIHALAECQARPTDVIARSGSSALVAGTWAHLYQAEGLWIAGVAPLQRYHQLIASIKATYQGTPVGATESIFSYLAPSLGLKLITPDSYLNAVSEGQDISATDIATVNQQISQKLIKVLIYNSQNTPPNIQSLIDLTKSNNIPVATITETLTPATASFQDWQSAQLEGIQKALAQATGK